MSIAIRSMEMRPAIGQRWPATTASALRTPSTAARGPEISVGITRSDNGQAGRPPRGPGRAITDGVAALDVANLHDARLEVDDLLHRVGRPPASD